MSGIAHEQRFSRNQPCPICGGWATMQRGAGSRCWGFIGSDGGYSHCTRPERAGALPPAADGTYVHKLNSDCRCGELHGQVVIVIQERVPRGDFDASAAAQAIWQRGHTAEGSLVQRYLASRGITTPVPPSLRSLRSLRHAPSGTEWPCMLAAITVWPARLPVAIQRTYLRPDGKGKAPVDPPRMSLGPMLGGAVRLGPPGDELVVAEGVETALSVQQATGISAWAVVGVRNMPNLVLPDNVAIVIAADRDTDGQDWARRAARRWLLMGRRVRLVLPPPGVGDFNDLLVRGAA